jgi:hypothetical protein
VRADRYPAGRFPWWLVAVCLLIIGVAATTVHVVAPPPAQPVAAPDLYSPDATQPHTAAPVPRARPVRPVEPAVATIVPHVPAVESVPLTKPTAPTAPSLATTVEYPSVTGLTIPALRINTGLIIRVGVQPDGSMETPPLSNVAELGWYCPNLHTTAPGCGAPLPGDPGPATLVAHVDGKGKLGLFAHLSRLKAGDQITVHRSDHKIAVFTVSTLQMADKAAFPGQQIFGDTADPELRLITCGGPFDPAARSYTQNVVVSASLTALRTAAS